MNYTDEQLSAFLDAELSEQEMMNILQQLSSDTVLAGKLGKLAAVQAIVDKHSKQPDDIATTVTAASSGNATQQVSTSNVVHLTLPDRTPKVQRRTLAFATTAALVGGLSLAQLMPSSTTGELVPASEVITVLNSGPSGTRYSLANNSQLYPQLTFLDQQQQFCRQYEITKNKDLLQQVACKTERGWILAATVKLAASNSNSAYQPASGSSLLDHYVDSIIQGQVISPEQELTLIKSAWPAKQQPR